MNLLIKPAIGRNADKDGGGSGGAGGLKGSYDVGITGSEGFDTGREKRELLFSLQNISLQKGMPAFDLLKFNL